MFDPVQRLRHNCRALVLALKHFWKHFYSPRFSSIKSLLLKRSHAFVAVELVQRNDSRVSSQIYRIALAHDETKERETKEEEKKGRRL
jgi:hypothetical protein